VIGNLGPTEVAIFIALASAPFALGWFLLRAWDRRNTAARDLYQLTQEVAALTEQNSLLADELAELALEAKAASRLIGSDASPVRPAKPNHSQAT